MYLLYVIFFIVLIKFELFGIQINLKWQTLFEKFV